jgi:hypothetical protein
MIEDESDNKLPDILLRHGVLWGYDGIVQKI